MGTARLLRSASDWLPAGTTEKIWAFERSPLASGRAGP